MHGLGIQKIYPVQKLSNSNRPQFYHFLVFSAIYTTDIGLGTAVMQLVITGCGKASLTRPNPLSHSEFLTTSLIRFMQGNQMMGYVYYESLLWNAVRIGSDPLQISIYIPNQF